MQMTGVDRKEPGFRKLLRTSPGRLHDHRSSLGNITCRSAWPQVFSHPFLVSRVHDDVNGRHAAYRPLGTDLSSRSLYSSLSAEGTTPDAGSQLLFMILTYSDFHHSVEPSKLLVCVTGLLLAAHFQKRFQGHKYLHIHSLHVDFSMT